MIKFDIDGKELSVEQGTSIIQAADDAGIEIPRFCYHKKLSIAANCRMCLVEVVNAPKPMPACATPVAEGMQVKTKSSKALMAQRAVMEFLLINHPLDCPICDQGGECELQDVSIGYGEGISKYNQGKRSVKDEDIGPLIATGMTRCIHCTRCVRFGEEVAGMKELGGLGRGEFTEIRTFVNNAVTSELSGNLIDVCPVGALTSKPYRFSARTWELQQYPSIAVHDAVGSNIYVHSVNNTPKRVVPRENESINEVWLSDRDRFSYEALNHEERLLTPLLRVDDRLEATDWETALSGAADIILEQIKQDPNDLIALISPNATVEEGYLLQKILRNLGSNNIDFRLKSPNTFDYGAKNTSLAKLEQADNILLVGSCPRKSIPLLNHRIRKAALNGANVNTLNIMAYDWNYDLNVDHIVSPENFVTEFCAVLKCVLERTGNEVPRAFSKIKPGENARLIAQNLYEAENSVIIFGELAASHPDSEYLYKLFNKITTVLNNGSIILSQGSNSKGLKYAGAVPYLKPGGYQVSNCGDGIRTAFDRPDGQGVYILFNIDPEYDCENGLKALKKLQKSAKVIVFSPFISENITKYADIVFPLAPFTETSGTLVNIDNEWQTFSASVAASRYSKVRPGWKILCALAKVLDLTDEEYSYESSSDVKQEVFGLNADLISDDTLSPEEQDCFEQSYSSKLNTQNETDLVMATLITETNCYRIDNIVRRAESLQQTADCNTTNSLVISSSLADKISVCNGDELAIASNSNLDDIIRQKVVIDNRLTGEVAYLATGIDKTLHLAQPYKQVILINKK